MLTFESSVTAFVALIGATVVMMAIAGPVLAYLVWANEHGIQAGKRWAIWLVSMTGLLAWAHTVGVAMATPGIEDAYAFVALGLGIPIACFGFILKRRMLQKREL